MRGVCNTMEIWQTERLTGNALTDAYLQGDPRMSDRFEFSLHQPDALKRRCHTVDHVMDRKHRSSLVEAMREYALELGQKEAHTAALLDKLSDERSMVVVTGQQAGLFSGPLYTVYKAVSTVVLAKQYEQEMCRPIVPIFWIATEDHDFDEVASAYYVNKEAKVSHVHLHDRPNGRVPVGMHEVSRDELDRLLIQLEIDLPAGTYKEQLLQDLLQAYSNVSNMGDGFARFMARLLRDVPILFVNPIRPSFRSLVKDAFARVIHNPNAFIKAAQMGTEALVKRGFSPQVDVHPDHSLLFLVDRGHRYALDVDRSHGHDFILRDSDLYFSKEELLLRLEEHPSDFSSGVLYRPVVQDFLLPVLTYVGGAAEIAYHGMMKEIFTAAGRHLPILQLRMRVMAVPTAVSRALDHLGMELEDGIKRDLLKESLVKDLMPPLTTVTKEMQDKLRNVLHEYEDYFLGIDKTLRPSLERAEEMVTRSLRHIENRSIRALVRKDQDTVYAAAVVSAWLRPHGTEQERLLSPLSLVAKYGSSWLPALLELAHSPTAMTYVRF